MEKRNERFKCENCKKLVRPANDGKCRNHCNFCLYSKHLDISPGDRKHPCKGLMEPIKLEKRGNIMYIQHCCLKCKIKKWNKIHKDDKITRILKGEINYG